MIVDAHQHFWQLSLAETRGFDYRWLAAKQHEPIHRDFLPADLQPLLAAAGVERSIFVQTQHRVEENRWVLELAGQHEFIAGVVGWVDLASPECERQLEEFCDNRKFVGVRHITQDEPDENFILRDDVLRGLRALERKRVPFDLLFYVKHLRHAATLAARLPELRMVVDHLAKPSIADHRVDDWFPALQAAAQFPNVYCKLSGMVTEADWRAWTPDDLKPYVHAALEAFGPERCMYGSDWPVCLLAGSYARVIEALRKALGPISDDERRMIFGGTACKFYGLA